MLPNFFADDSLPLSPAVLIGFCLRAGVDLDF